MTIKANKVSEIKTPKKMICQARLKILNSSCYSLRPRNPHNQEQPALRDHICSRPLNVWFHESLFPPNSLLSSSAPPIIRWERYSNTPSLTALNLNRVPQKNVVQCPEAKIYILYSFFTKCGHYRNDKFRFKKR